MLNMESGGGKEDGDLGMRLRTSSQDARSWIAAVAGGAIMRCYRFGLHLGRTGHDECRLVLLA